MLLYKSIGKSALSGNLKPFQDLLTNLTGISGEEGVQMPKFCGDVSENAWDGLWCLMLMAQDLTVQNPDGFAMRPWVIRYIMMTLL